MKNQNYINIQGWMINELKLNGNELILYAIIFGFTQDGQNQYHGSLRYMEQAMRVSRNTVIKNRDSLVEKGYIKVVKNKKTGNRYYADLEVVQKLNQGGAETEPLGGAETEPNNNNTNNKDNIATEVAKEFVLVDEIADMLEGKSSTNKLIAYWMTIGMQAGVVDYESKITNSKILGSIIQRHCKDAKKILNSGYEKKRIVDAIRQAAENSKKNSEFYTMGYVYKLLTK